MEHSGGTRPDNGNTAAPAAGRRIRRRWPAILVALAALAAAGCGASSSSGSGPSAPAIAHEPSGTGSRSGITGGALFGGNPSLIAVERSLGRRLGIVRDYYRFGETFPDPTDAEIMATGSTLMVSLDTKPGHGPNYAQIAAGQVDSYLRGFLQAVNEAAIRYHLPAIYFSFEHEADFPGKHQGLGSPAQFIQAWDHIHQLAASMHLNWNDGGRIRWVWIQLHTTFVPLDQRSAKKQKLGAPTAYWPGRNEVDIVGADGYNHPGCQGTGGQETPESLFGPAVRFARQNGGLPVFITEWGSTPGSSSEGQSGFISQMNAFVAANPEIVAVMYWNSGAARCNFSVDAHPASVSALATMARSTAFQGRLG